MKGPAAASNVWAGIAMHRRHGMLGCGAAASRGGGKASHSWSSASALACSLLGGESKEEGPDWRETSRRARLLWAAGERRHAWR